MRPARVWFWVMVLGLALAIPWSWATDAPRVDKETLRSWLGDPGVVIVDVRAPGDWRASNRKIPGALRRNPRAVQSWAKELSKDKKIVLYCA